MAEAHPLAPLAQSFDSRRQWRACLLLAAAGLAADQALKALVVSSLDLGEHVFVTSWFNIMHVLNPGAAFSFLADAGGWQRWFFVAVSIAVSMLLAGLLWRGVASRLETAAYVGLIGGALGNVVDRLRLGAVVDYLDLHWRGMHWPAFNLAGIQPGRHAGGRQRGPAGAGVVRAGPSFATAATVT